MFRKVLGLALLISVPAVASSGFEVRPFSPDEKIGLVEADGLVTLQTITFKVSGNRVMATILAACDEGKDQLVEVDVSLLDQSGEIVAKLQGKGKVEEEDKAKIKLAARLTPDQIGAIDSFQVALYARAD